MSHYTTPRAIKKHSVLNGKLTSPLIKETLSDRFIPMRNNNTAEVLIDEEVNEIKEDNEEAYMQLLKTRFETIDKSAVCKKLCFDEPTNTEVDRKGKILSFRAEYTRSQNTCIDNPINYLVDKNINKPTKRKLPKTPLKVLDSPGLKDTPVYDILDWSSKDIIGVAIDNIIYSLRKIGTLPSMLTELPSCTQISSLAFNPSGNILAAGSLTTNGYLIDLPKIACRTFQSKGQTTSLDWRDDNTFSIGLRSEIIVDYDIRQRNSITRILDTKTPIISLKWSSDNNLLCASSSEGKVILWDARQKSPLLKTNGHTAFVKGLAWASSSQFVSACINGRIRIWNTVTAKCIKEIETSEVWSLLMSRNTGELVTGHGDALNEVTIWNMNGNKEGSLIGHQMKVTQLALSPLGTQLLTAAGDETLRFWDVFPSNEKEKEDESIVNLSCIGVR